MFIRFSISLLLALSAIPCAADTPPVPASESTSVETPIAGTAKNAPTNTVSLADIRRFTAVYSLVKQAYVEDISDEKLMQAAIRGMLSNLDPHSEYLDRVQMELLTEETNGSYAGLGIEVAGNEGVLRVIAPFDGTPAQRAGIRAGDVILRIDGKPIVAAEVNDAIDQLRGKPGSEVVLSVIREGLTKPIDVHLEREIIHIASVSGRLVEPGYGYLRIAQFQAETGTDLRKRVAQLLQENAGPLKGAVLDLRSNPGGLVSAAVDVSDQFLSKGTIVSTRGRVAEADLSFDATPGDSLNGTNLVVLIDNGSASASEIVAGALKDNHRAVLMGRRSFGKGSVQTVLPIDGDFAVKLTTARYYTPDGTSIQAQGISPDVVLVDKDSADGAASGFAFSERDLPNHLANGEETALPASGLLPIGAKTDYALGRAISRLKAMASGQKQTAATAVPKG
ncbi:MAG: S41 family peptidase [Dokdonella sp.]